jgi:hypothetical protein
MDKIEIAKVMSELGKRSAKSLTPEQRKERATKAVMTRWAKRCIIDGNETKPSKNK